MRPSWSLQPLLLTAGLLATPAMAELSPAQKAVLEVFRFELRSQASAKALLANDMTYAGEIKEGAPLRKGWLDGFWPWNLLKPAGSAKGAGKPERDEPPTARSLFSHLRELDQIDQPGRFLVQFQRYVGTLAGEAAGTGGKAPYLHASLLPDGSGNEELAKVLAKDFGGTSEAWPAVIPWEAPAPARWWSGWNAPWRMSWGPTWPMSPPPRPTRRSWTAWRRCSGRSGPPPARPTGCAPWSVN